MAIKKEFSKDKDERATSSDLNNNFQEIDNKFRTNIIKDKTGTPRVLIGEQKDGFGTGDDYGIKVSQAGSDVTTTTDNNLVMSSAFNMLKVVEIIEDTITISNGSYSQTTSYSHSQSTAPAGLGFVTYSGENVPMPAILGIGTGTPVIEINRVAYINNIDTNSVDITYARGGSSGDDTISFKVYLFIETVN